LKQYLYPILLLLFLGCKGEAELAMERGIQYYEWEKIEKAILEFKYVIHILSAETGKTHYKQIQLLSRAYHNLAVAYAKKTWYKDALKEAEKAFELIPTDNNRKVIDLIQNKLLSKPESLSSSESANR
jgi:tetratricopeptide (TPR) repeat protein